MRKIKLIWDFRTSDAAQLAEHHAKHLEEFVRKEKYHLNIIGHESLNSTHAIAYLVVEESDMIQFRDTLRPHRAVVYKV